MRIFFFLISALFALTVTAQAETFWSADSRAPSFCLQNFNAYGPIYASGVTERSELAAGFFQALPKCDVVHLQEVWNDTQIDIFEKRLARQYNISAPNRQAKIGLMSFFMGDVKDTKTYYFQVNNEGGVLDTVRAALNVKKAFHIVKTQFPGLHEDLYFVNTHLHPSSTAVRLTQILDLLRWRLERQELKLLLSGDFNADVNSLERKLVMATLGAHDAMSEHFGGSYPEGYCTYCAGNPLGWLLSDRTFDYIFYSNIGRSTTSLKVIDGKVNMRGTPRKPLSDHFGVRVQFTVLSEVSEVEQKTVEARRAQALGALMSARDLLVKQKGEEFRPYLQYVKSLTQQLQERRGPFNLYFESFR